MQDKSEKRFTKRGKGTLMRKVGEGEHLKIYVGMSEGMETKTYLHGPMDAAKKVKLRVRVGDLDLPERRDVPVVGRRRK